VTTQKTRCPYCSSVFAVSNAQLAIRDGYTRCGKCFQVFKADDYLIATKAPETAETSNTETPSATLDPKANRSHIVDLHKIDSTKSKGFDKALDSFLDPKKLPLPSIIDFVSTKKEKVDLSVLPNEHPEPEERAFLNQDPDAYLAPEIEDLSEQLNHEFNEQWLTETANPTNPLAQPINHEDDINTVKDTHPQPNPDDALESVSNSDEDLMSYLNKNSVPEAQVKTKTGRILPGMNDFHANQRSKKSAKSIPMHINIAKRNQALDRLTARKKWFTLDSLHILGWSFASLLMVGLLVAQYLFFNFDHLAANPRYQPTMHKACLMLGCDVPLIDLEKIKVSNVSARHFQLSPSDSTIFTATITNKAEESQPFPNLRIVVIKDKKVLSGRIIHPAEYLKSGYNSQARIAVNHPTQIEFILKIQREQIPALALDPVN
jgi:predicted Zn finger-like uncharacterized protein